MPLGPGSIAFVGFSADGSDNIAFVALDFIEAGTTIFFCDREWDGSAFNTGEGGWSWTAPQGGVAAGTIVTISDADDQFTPESSTNIGSVSGGSGLSATDEILYAFTGVSLTEPTRFLAALPNRASNT